MPSRQSQHSTKIAPHERYSTSNYDPSLLSYRISAAIAPPPARCSAVQRTTPAGGGPASTVTFCFLRWPLPTNTTTYAIQHTTKRGGRVIARGYRSVAAIPHRGLGDIVISLQHNPSLCHVPLVSHILISALCFLSSSLSSTTEALCLPRLLHRQSSQPQHG